MCLFDYSMLILCFTYTFKIIVAFLSSYGIDVLSYETSLFGFLVWCCTVNMSRFRFSNRNLFILCMIMYSIWLILIFQFSVSVLDSSFNIFFIGLFWGILWYFYVHYFILFTYVPGRPSHITCLCCAQEDGSGPFWHDNCLIFHVACHVTHDYCSLAI